MGYHRTEKMSLISRISRLSYSQRLPQTKLSMNNGLYLSPIRGFAGHGPPTRIGFPHEWGAMKWFPCKTFLGVIVFIQLQMFGLIMWYKWDTIPYPAHRYNDANTTARNY